MWAAGRGQLMWGASGAWGTRGAAGLRARMKRPGGSRTATHGRAQPRTAAYNRVQPRLGTPRLPRQGALAAGAEPWCVGRGAGSERR